MEPRLQSGVSRGYNKITTIASNFNISAANNLAVTNEYLVTSPAQPMRIQGNIIYFNDAYLANASQEYMVAAYLHEVCIRPSNHVLVFKDFALGSSAAARYDID